ncbi:hypothetical protein PLESTB_001317000 [Pleodorina starrii]|uniref:Uncharacterized protein n=1 Tax=Pleodorina starrii TaxID=330485 RepID=A0A9W6BUK9_9CHLO|nr:hypothetical protein PLESTM_001765700 [Pleodorina starrii]GLC58087.1 hypothetical protein PLESTB_001317000 [Pleodorina starrii]GLC66777.1 hypothetical protein PLESTF_000473300 [Pleodorina starrii]
MNLIAAAAALHRSMTAGTNVTHLQKVLMLLAAVRAWYEFVSSVKEYLASVGLSAATLSDPAALVKQMYGSLDLAAAVRVSCEFISTIKLEEVFASLGLPAPTISSLAALVKQMYGLCGSLDLTAAMRASCDFFSGGIKLTEYLASLVGLQLTLSDPAALIKQLLALCGSLDLAAAAQASYDFLSGVKLEEFFASMGLSASAISNLTALSRQMCGPLGPAAAAAARAPCEGIGGAGIGAFLIGMTSNSPASSATDGASCGSSSVPEPTAAKAATAPAVESTEPPSSGGRSGGRKHKRCKCLRCMFCCCTGRSVDAL